MNMLAARTKLVAFLALFVFLCLIVVFVVTRISEAENRLSPAENAILANPQNVVPENSAKIKFVTAATSKDEGLRIALEAQEINVSQITPLTLATGDLNDDGFPDLVCGYEAPGGGLVVIHYGDERAYAPTDLPISRQFLRIDILARFVDPR